MPPRKKPDATPNDGRAVDYRYTGEKRTNIPPARIAGEGAVPVVPKARYAYSPHLSPTLEFDPTGEPDKLDSLVEKATIRALTATEATRLQQALRVSEPTLEWAGKREQREKGYLEVDPVALHIHERVSARAIIRSALREDVQRDLFADPQQSYKEAVQFYKHDVEWANRLILGDSLQVMSSLGRRENLAGKVQMIYMDPPYGIKFASNFQSRIGSRDVKEKDDDLTREAEMVRAYRDTWTLGVHSYLSYLRDRLMLARELLNRSGSIFVQISDEHVHRVRALLDEVFGQECAVAVIPFKKTSGAGSISGGTTTIAEVCDYVLWYARDIAQLKYQQLYLPKELGGDGASQYTWIEAPTGERRRMNSSDNVAALLASGHRVFGADNLTSSSGVDTTRFPVEFAGRTFAPHPGVWKTGAAGMPRLLGAERVLSSGKNLSYVRYIDDFSARPLSNFWDDTVSSFMADKVYVVQTNTKIVERCMLMSTDPGDLVLDPTCGSGTTAYVSEYWGRRWITIDTSRVALSLARQRLLTSRFEYYQTQSQSVGNTTRGHANPGAGFYYKTLARITLRSIAQNAALDPLLARHAAVLEKSLDRLNAALREVPDVTRARLQTKLDEKVKTRGLRSVSESERRMWLLPRGAFSAFNVPFEADPDWPSELTAALRDYREAWTKKKAEVRECIEQAAEQILLVDQPSVTKGVIRVSGPFTVEGVRPEELNLDQGGDLDGTLRDDETDDGLAAAAVQQRNVHAYLERMTRLIRQDGLTFLNNQRRRFAAVEPLFDVGTGTTLHAEGAWSDASSPEIFGVAIGFGPQYGPVTALQVEGLIRSTKRHSELVIAGFSFDADATAMIQEQSHPKLRIHQAYIRPDVNPGMDGLLKDTPNSQLFTVFGTPEIEISKTKDGDYAVHLKGVDIYDPVANTVRSTGADKVAAWFLDSDFDGRCFCVTQAFFPDQDAWEKIVKALGSAADSDAFEAFKGTTSIPFAAGAHSRIAVKVIDPRGNEVMVVCAIDK